MDIYLDESGCTGFKFDYPYLNGGSSRFLILGYCAIPNGENSNLLRITRKVFSNNKVNFKERELKGNSLKGNKAIQALHPILQARALSGLFSEAYKCTSTSKTQDLKSFIMLGVLKGLAIGNGNAITLIITRLLVPITGVSTKTLFL